MSDKPINLATGLCTFDILKIMLFYELERVQRYPMPLTLLRIAVELTGPDIQTIPLDEVQLTVAQILNIHLRAADVPGHYEDDYLVTLAVTDEAGGLIVAKRLVEFLSQPQKKRQGNIIQLNVYMGMASLPQGSKVTVDEFIAQGSKMAVDDFIAQATMALGEARKRGPGTVVAFSELV